MAKKKIISVTQDHIERGIQGSSKFCPIARAFVSAGFQDAVVGLNLASFTEKGWLRERRYTAVPLPEMARRFAHNFDMGRQPQPFSFTLTY